MLGPRRGSTYRRSSNLTVLLFLPRGAEELGAGDEAQMGLPPAHLTLYTAMAVPKPRAPTALSSSRGRRLGFPNCVPQPLELINFLPKDSS